MIFTDKSGLYIKTNGDYISCANVIYDMREESPKDIMKSLYYKVGLGKKNNIIIDEKPDYYTKADTIVLLTIGINNLSVFCSRDCRYYDITFSYNFPIFIENKLVPLFVSLVDDLVKSQLIVLVETEDFILVNVSNRENYTKFKRRINYLVKRNDRDFKIIYGCDLEIVLRRWQRYCSIKFNRFYSQDVIDTYLKIYSTSGFLTTTYVYNSEVAAQGIIFVSEQSKIIYACLLAWDDKFKTRSPGIYAYTKMICKCFDEGYNFSICYGSQKYKLDLLREFI